MNTRYGLLAGDQRRRAAKTIWQRPDNGFWVLQEKMALHLSRKTEGRYQMNRHTSSVRFVNRCQLPGREDAQFSPLLCYPLPAAPLS